MGKELKNPKPVRDMSSIIVSTNVLLEWLTRESIQIKSKFSKSSTQNINTQALNGEKLNSGQ